MKRTEEKQMKHEMVSLRFKVGLDGKPDKTFDLTLYAFDKQGAFLASAPVGKEGAKLELPKHAAMDARLMVAPTLPGASAESAPTIAQLQRARAYEPAWIFAADQRDFELLPVPEYHWHFWPWCRCRVRGKVVRPVQIGGVTYDLPVCHARVHICEVDPLFLLIPRLPDPIIIRLRDELLHLIERPFPPRPGPGPDPGPEFQFDPGVIDPSPINVARLQRYQGAPLPFDRMAAKAQSNLAAMSGEDMGQSAPLSGAALPASAMMRPGEEAMLNPQPLPPKELAASIPLELRSALASPSVAVVKQALLSNVALIRPWLCWWPWLWPYFYTCDPIAVLDTDNQGRFDTTIWYLCFGDHLDLYFWVEYCIGGVWTTVYHPSIPCHTYWNYVCGSEVIIRVTDPRVPWCGPGDTVPGKQVAVLLIGNGVSIPEIQGAAAGVNEGLTTAGEPFGGSLEPHVWFGDGLLPSGINHYRWSYRKFGEMGWHAMDRQVVRHYAEVMADSTLTFKPYQLGPDPAFAGQNLFKLRPANPPLNPGAVSSSWAPEVDARENTASAFFLSHLLDSGDAALAAGKYELKLELFKGSALVNWTQENVLPKVPTIAGPFGPGTVPTVAPAAEHLITHGVNDGFGAATDIVAFRLVLHVDNNRCSAVINPVSVDGNVANQCGFVRYASKVMSNAFVSFLASHPNNFANFSFTIARGSAGVIESASGPVGSGPSPVGNYARSIASVFSKNVPVSALLGPCDKAAFAENLHVSALATDGWSTLTYLDVDAVPVAFALEPAN